MNEKLEVIDTQALAPDTMVERSADEMKRRRLKVREVMKAVMRKGVHFGPPYPGSDKDTLLKPGAVALGETFRYRPDFEVVERICPDDGRDYAFIKYTIRCRLFHTLYGVEVGQALGTCNSFEEKYRYNVDWTDKEVPKGYWKMDSLERRAALDEYGPSYEVRKSRGKWKVICKVPVVNLYEKDNTVESIACKRAHTAAIIYATGAADMFSPADIHIDEDGSKEDRGVAENGGSQGPTAADSLESELMDLGIALEKNPDMVGKAIHTAKKDGAEAMLELKQAWTRLLKEKK